MFTGIVEEVGSVRELSSRGLAVACGEVVSDTHVGDSISVNGVCLTATQVDADGFAADVMGETRARTALADLEPGSPVNLERALRADGRLGGHLVQGHVDAVSEVLDVAPQAGQDWAVLRVALPASLSPYVVAKGSVTVDGVSLTVMAVDDDGFSVGLIPHTQEVTVLGRRARGDRVNLEADVVAKYVERILRAGVPSPYHPDAPAGRS